MANKRKPRRSRGDDEDQEVLMSRGKQTNAAEVKQLQAERKILNENARKKRIAESVKRNAKTQRRNKLLGTMRAKDDALRNVADRVDFINVSALPRVKADAKKKRTERREATKGLVRSALGGKIKRDKAGVVRDRGVRDKKGRASPVANLKIEDAFLSRGLDPLPTADPADIRKKKRKK